jgi:hypothetical protein
MLRDPFSAEAFTAFERPFGPLTLHTDVEALPAIGTFVDGVLEVIEARSRASVHLCSLPQAVAKTQGEGG